MFQDRYCDRCVRDEAFRDGSGDSCEIAAQGYGVAIGLTPPVEWVAENGLPRCTAFTPTQGARDDG